MSVQLFSVPASQKNAGPKSCAAAGRAEVVNINASTNAPKNTLLELLLIG